MGKNTKSRVAEKKVPTASARVKALEVIRRRVARATQRGKTLKQIAEADGIAPSRLESYLKEAAKSGAADRSQGHRWQGTGEEIRVPTGTDADARYSVLQLYSLCSYPSILEKPKRDPFTRAYHAWMYKLPILSQCKDKYDGAAVRKLVPPDYRQMSNQQVGGKLRNWSKRMGHCMDAAKIAARLYFKGQRVPYQTLEGIRVLEITGPETVTETVHDLLRLHGVKDVNQKTAEWNALELTLHKFAPVAHLGLTLWLYFEGCNPRLSDKERFLDLAERPEWIHDALLFAEGLRAVLGEKVPYFNPARAARLLPAASSQPIPHRRVPLIIGPW